MRRRALAALIVLGLTVSACAADTPSSTPSPTADASPPAATTDDASPTASPSPSPSPSSSPSPEPTGAAAMSDAELAEVGANELGRVLVMQWHEIKETDGRWANSLATFRAQLEELHERGYRPISATEFIEGTFDIPAGTSPVLLTFDDSYKEHFYFAEDGQTPHPDSVVGILRAMHERDPTWRPRALFSFYWPVPFRETDRELIERKLNWLVDHGFDLANHTYNHENLREMTDAEVQRNLARAEAELAEVVGDDYRVRVMTLTQGIWPENRDLAMAGEADGFRYEHDIALEVGFMPTRSPHHAEYDPRSVQRVQGYVPEFEKWVQWLDEEPGRRLVSDGDPDTVTYPASWSDVAEPQEGLHVRTYEQPTPAPSAEPGG